jgi:hypothetical protein
MTRLLKQWSQLRCLAWWVVLVEADSTA